MILEMIPNSLQRVAEGRESLIPADMNLADGDSRPGHDQRGLAGVDKVLGEAFREPEWDFGGAQAGVAVGEFEEEDVNDAADHVNRLGGCGEIDLVLPAFDEGASTDESGLTVGHARIEDDMDVSTPGVGQLQGAQEGALDGFARHDQGVGGQFDQIRGAGSEAAGRRGRGEASVRSDDELAGAAASDLKFRISEQLAQIGRVRNRRELGGCDDADQEEVYGPTSARLLPAGQRRERFREWRTHQAAAGLGAAGLDSDLDVGVGVAAGVASVLVVAGLPLAGAVSFLAASL